MRNLIVPVVLMVSVAVLVIATTFAQTDVNLNAESQIEQNVRLLFDSIRQRNVDDVRRLLSSKLIAIESGDSANVGVIDTKDANQLLPPPGNNDWNAISLSNFIVQLSETDPSVGMVAFRLSRKLDVDSVRRIQSLLDANELPDSDRIRLQRQITMGAKEHDLFAMVARQDGTWRIACISLPH